MASHAKCVNGHVCQVPSGQTCIEHGCDEAAGTRWGPLWCPVHDKERLDRVTASLQSLVASFGGSQLDTGELGSECHEEVMPRLNRPRPSHETSGRRGTSTDLTALPTVLSMLRPHADILGDQ